MFDEFENALIARAREIQERHIDELLAKPNVVGVGVGMRQRGGSIIRQLCIVVMVSHKVPCDALQPDDCIPPEIEGIPVDVQETGIFSAQA